MKNYILVFSESCDQEDELEDEESTNKTSQKQTHTEVDAEVKTLIKSVANEIQKSFSIKNFDILNDEGEEEGETDDTFFDALDTNEANAKGVEVKAANETKAFEPVLEAPIDFDATPVLLDNSINKAKLNVIRKSSRERRAPSIGRRANTSNKNEAANKIKKLIEDKIAEERAATPNQDPVKANEQSDEDKAEFLAKEMAKLESSQVVHILKSMEKGILDCSLPLLIPFLSIQVRLAMSKNIFSDLDLENKKIVIKESVVESLINDITDIAILQEVIDRSQEKPQT